MKSQYFWVHIGAIALVILTLLSTWLSQHMNTGLLLVSVVTLTVILKGQLIVDIFMELAKAPPKWRYLLLSYAVLVPIILALISLLH